MTNNTSLRTLTLSFDLPLHFRQINHWRGAFIQMAGWQDEYFHNHDNNTHTNEPNAKKYHYRYPRIQYRVHRGKAAIFAINEGVEALQKILASSDWKIDWKGKAIQLKIEDLHMNEHYLRITNHLNHYKLKNWVALNARNHQLWQERRGMLAKTQLLQKGLENHLVGFCLSLAWNWPQPIEAHLELVRKVQPIKIHGTKLLAFDIDFSTNLLLPHSIAIGKSVSLGLGKVIPVKTRKYSGVPTLNIDLDSKNVEMESAKS